MEAIDETTVFTKPRLSTIQGNPCPCGSGLVFDQCCEPLLSSRRLPENAEQLMRARFSAYVARDVSFLRKTAASEARLNYIDPTEEEDVEWLKLTVHRHEEEASGDKALVEFSAFFRERGTNRVHQEISQFSKEPDGWKYVKALR